ncbi:MAG: PRC-barrel domain-containing protein [Thermodesulfobacteriota bacterium]|nr:PRC-barrel domain-containing protein [Thermodesulfobacteriota bacterium]
MLRNVSEIHNYVLEAEDGEIGRCNDFLFDDELWTIHHMVANTSKWLLGRKVLISPFLLDEPDWNLDRLPVKLSREQIKNSPSLDSDKPISRQYERLLFDNHKIPHYWDNRENGEENEHLRSTHEVTGYHLSAKDGEIGHIDDFIIETDSWIIKYLVVDTKNWLPGRKVLLAPNWLESIEWISKKVIVNLTKEQIEQSPEYTSSTLITREYESQLYDYYDFPKYWE